MSSTRRAPTGRQIAARLTAYALAVAFFLFAVQVLDLHAADDTSTPAAAERWKDETPAVHKYGREGARKFDRGLRDQRGAVDNSAGLKAPPKLRRMLNREAARIAGTTAQQERLDGDHWWNDVVNKTSCLFWSTRTGATCQEPDTEQVHTLKYLGQLAKHTFKVTLACGGTTAIAQAHSLPKLPNAYAWGSGTIACTVGSFYVFNIPKL